MKFAIAIMCSVIAGLCMVISMLDEQKDTKALRTADCCFNAVADVSLGGWVGFILCVVGVIRNNTEWFDRLITEKYSAFEKQGQMEAVEQNESEDDIAQKQVKPSPLASILSGNITADVVKWAGFVVALGVGVVGGDWYFIVFAEIIYTLAEAYLDPFKAESVLAIDLVCWLAYDLHIGSYGMVLADVFVFVRQLFIMSKTDSGSAFSVHFDKGVKQISKASKIAEKVFSMFAQSAQSTTQTQPSPVLQPTNGQTSTVVMADPLPDGPGHILNGRDILEVMTFDLEADCADQPE